MGDWVHITIVTKRIVYTLQIYEARTLTGIYLGLGGDASQSIKRQMQLAEFKEINIIRKQ